MDANGGCGLVRSTGQSVHQTVQWNQSIVVYYLVDATLDFFSCFLK